MLLRHRFLIFIDFAAKGILTPVLSLFIIYKNVEPSKLPIVMLFYSSTVLLMEIPSGIFADSFGKKKCYQLSIVLYMLSCLLGLIGTGFWLTVFFAILMGLGKAFGSGSLDALLINHYIEKEGHDCIPKVNSCINILSGFGIALGGIIGGYIAISINFEVFLITRIITYITILIYSFIALKNIDSFEEKQNPFALTKEGVSLVKKEPTLMLVLIFTLTLGIMMVSLETYWQLRFVEIIANKSLASYIGIVSFLGFSFSSIGSYFGGKYYKKLWHSPLRLYIGFSILLALSYLFLSMQNAIVGFIICYVLWYFVLGIGNIGEASLLNSNVPNHIRATILSLSSFALQIGAIISSTLSSALYSGYGINGTWLIISSCSLIIFVFTTIIFYKHRKKQTKSL